MGKCTFKGGCHPYDGKEFSKDKPIKELFPAVGEMVFPLSQHIGAPAKPVVAKGVSLCYNETNIRKEHLLMHRLFQPITSLKYVAQKRAKLYDKLDITRFPTWKTLLIL